MAILWKNIRIKYFARRVFLLNEITMFLFFFIQVALMGLAFRMGHVDGVGAPFFSWALVGFLIWNVSGRTAYGVSRSLFNEMSEGTFPIIMTAPTPLLLVVLAHLVTEVIIWIPVTMGVLATTTAMFRESLSVGMMLS